MAVITIGMLSTFFLGFLVIMAMLVIAACGRYLGRNTTLQFAAALLAWIIYVGLLGYFGIIKNTTMRPPGIAFIFIPVILFFLVVILRPVAATRIAIAFPLWILLGTQVFRVGVELFLHQLWLDGLAPKMLTFAGANVDIYIGATAPLIAWFSMRKKSGLKIALVWNVLGLFALANVVIRAVLTTPGPLNFIHAEIPNQLIGTFPFMFVPGFFVPLALLLHILAIQNIKAGKQQ